MLDFLTRFKPTVVTPKNKLNTKYVFHSIYGKDVFFFLHFPWIPSSCPVFSNAFQIQLGISREERVDFNRTLHDTQGIVSSCLLQAVSIVS